MFISAGLYGLGILFFFDRALLMLGNILFVCGLCILVGAKETIMFFLRKIKGSLALLIGLIFIVIKWRFIGGICQLFGLYEFFKAYALQLLSYFEWIPFIGPYITKLRKGSLKKNDDAYKV